MNSDFLNYCLEERRQQLNHLCDALNAIRGLTDFTEIHLVHLENLDIESLGFMGARIEQAVKEVAIWDKLISRQAAFLAETKKGETNA